MKTREEFKKELFRINAIPKNSDNEEWFNQIVDDTIEFAQRWIPIEEEMPENGFEILLHSEEWITEYNPNGVRIGFLDNTEKRQFVCAYWDCGVDVYSDITVYPKFWRPIEIK